MVLSSLCQIAEGQRAVTGPDQRAEAAGNAGDADRMRTVHQSLDLTGAGIRNDDGGAVTGGQLQARELARIGLRRRQFARRRKEPLKDRRRRRSPSEAVGRVGPRDSSEQITDVSNAAATGSGGETLSGANQRTNLHQSSRQQRQQLMCRKLCSRNPFSMHELLIAL
jgi:hypothetical protein